MNTKNFKHIYLVFTIFITVFTGKAYAVNNCITGDVSTDCSLGGVNVSLVNTGVVNNGSILGDGNGAWAGIIHDGTTIGKKDLPQGIINNGVITGWVNGISVGFFTSGTSIIAGGITNNSGGIISGFWGVWTSPSSYISYINNAGSIIGFNTNSGASSTDVFAGISNDGTIGIITNTGSIYPSRNLDVSFGIVNTGTITTLNNAQGAGNTAGALTYKGALPTNYNIIINSTSNYGQLAVNSGSGAMAFNIYGYTGQTLTSGVSASSVRNNYLYQNVLTGLIGSLSGSTITGTGFSITGAKGSYDGYSYTLIADDSNVSGVWDLFFGSLGPTAADTQSSMQYQASQLRSAFNTQTVAANFALNYDCNVFDVKGMCISAGGRYTTIDNPNINNSAAVVTLGYKVNPNIRMGAYLDQNINISNPTGINIVTTHRSWVYMLCGIKNKVV
jgi:hypothetical protein